MSRIADDLCAEVRHQCEQAEHFKGLWMQANDELERTRNAERTWETTMMKAIGEDGPRSVAEAIAKLESQRDSLIAKLSNHQRQAAIGRAVERACEELPEGWDLELALEKGAATVRLFIPDHDTYLHDFGSDVTLAEELDNAINTAIAKDAKGGAA